MNKHNMMAQFLEDEEKQRQLQLDRNKRILLQAFKKRKTEQVVKEKKRHIDRDREGEHERLFKQYFAENPTYPDTYFRRRFRMDKELFLRILGDLENKDNYFKQKNDATGRSSISGLLKMAISVRQLAYGVPPDMLDDQYGMAESTGRNALRHFCKAIIRLYGEEYLRSPTNEDVERILRENSERGFPGMLGSLDCMHWEWKNCPTGWHGMYKGKEKVPTIILEAVASKDRWIWHAFFGLPGSLNDINVLDRSYLFQDVANGQGPDVNFSINGHQYNMGYYLTDGIYPQYAAFVKGHRNPSNEKESVRINSNYYKCTF